MQSTTKHTISTYIVSDYCVGPISTRKQQCSCFIMILCKVRRKMLLPAPNHLHHVKLETCSEKAMSDLWSVLMLRTCSTEGPKITMKHTTWMNPCQYCNYNLNTKQKNLHILTHLVKFYYRSDTSGNNSFCDNFGETQQFLWRDSNHIFMLGLFFLWHV